MYKLKDNREQKTEKIKNSWSIWLLWMSNLRSQMSSKFDPTLQVLFTIVCYFNDTICKTFLSASMRYGPGFSSSNIRRDMLFKTKVPFMTSGNPTKRKSVELHLNTLTFPFLAFSYTSRGWRLSNNLQTFVFHIFIAKLLRVTHDFSASFSFPIPALTIFIVGPLLWLYVLSAVALIFRRSPIKQIRIDNKRTTVTI